MIAVPDTDEHAMRTLAALVLFPFLPLIRWAARGGEATFGFGHCPDHGVVAFSITAPLVGRRVVLLTPAESREWSEQFAYLAEKAELAASLRDDGYRTVGG